MRPAWARYIFWIGFAIMAVLAVAAFSAGTRASEVKSGEGAPSGSSAPQLTATPTATPCPGDYEYAQYPGATTVPGTTLVAGSQCDDCVVSVSLPFQYSLYDRSFSSAMVTANGQLVFATPADPSYTNICLPDQYSNYAIFAHWADLTMVAGYQACQQYPSGCGVFTSVSGSAPNRVFNLEWRALSFNLQHLVNFEVRLYEGQQRFDMVYATLDQPGASDTASIGVQKDTGSTFTMYQCPDQPGSLSNGAMLQFVYVSQCITGSPTSTATYTPTSTPSRTRTPTSTVTQTLSPTTTRTATLTATRTATSTPARSVTPTSTPTVASALLVGHVTWQARPAQPNALQQVPITLTLRSGGTLVDYPAQTTDASGFFTVTVSGLPPGTYQWRAKGPKWLANAGIVILSGAPTTQAEMGLMRSGDGNNDNFDDIGDFNILRPAFGRGCGIPGYDERTDYNADCLITTRDWYAMKINFGASGAPPISGAAR